MEESKILLSGEPSDCIYFDTELIVWKLDIGVLLMNRHYQTILTHDKKTQRVRKNMFDCLREFWQFQRNLRWESELQVKVGNELYQQVREI